MHNPKSTEVNFNSWLQPPAYEGYEIRDAAATVISEVADRLLTSQTTNKPYQPLWMPGGQTAKVVDRQTILLLKDMLHVDAVSHSAANALGKLSGHGESCIFNCVAD